MGLHSSHIFMFPFRFDVGYNAEYTNEFAFYNKKTIDKRINLDKLNYKLRNDNWEYEEFKIKGDDEHLLYNEFAYFYDYARDSMYNLGNFSKNSISNFYRKNEFNDKVFVLNIKQKVSGKYITEASSYKLIIKGVTLRVFNTGVAILSIELENNQYEDFSDILRINDYGRRIYPQFIGTDGIQNPKETFLADSIKIEGTDIDEKFDYKDFKDTHIGEHILKLLSKNVFTQDKNKQTHYYIQPSLDDRMFVISWYGNDNISKNLSKCESYRYSDDWYKYVFLDNGMVTVQNSIMKEQLLKESTYDRWSGFNTLFGISRYSFMVLTESQKSLIDNNADFIIDHTKTMYFQMMTLLLATRTSILRFSDEIAALASDEKLDVEKLTKLYKKYLIFYNRLYFKEVTHQDQGIELYDMARKQMKIDEHMEKLDGKFTKLFEFADLQEEKVRNRSLDHIQTFGAAFLVPSFVATIFGLEDIKKWFEGCENSGWYQAGILVSLALVSWAGVSMYLSRKKGR